MLGCGHQSYGTPYNARALFHLGKWPVTVTGLLVILSVVVGVLCTLIQPLFRLLYLEGDALMQGQVWRGLTYVFAEPIGLMWALGLYFFYRFGQEVEGTLSRRQYLTMIAVLVAIPVVFVLAFSFLSMASFAFPVLSLGVFVGYAALHPNAPLAILHIPIKWIALVIVLLRLLQSVGAGLWADALGLLGASVFVVLYIKNTGLGAYGLDLDKFKPSLRTAKIRKAGKKGRKPQQPKIRPRTTINMDSDEVDRILDKVSAEGFQSLTDAERKTLENASKK